MITYVYILLQTRVSLSTSRIYTYFLFRIQYSKPTFVENVIDFFSYLTVAILLVYIERIGIKTCTLINTPTIASCFALLFSGVRILLRGIIMETEKEKEKQAMEIVRLCH